MSELREIQTITYQVLVQSSQDRRNKVTKGILLSSILNVAEQIACLFVFFVQSRHVETLLPKVVRMTPEVHVFCQGSSCSLMSAVPVVEDQ
jgi:hypothetical protein